MEIKGLISVIIPVYNVEKYLKECVDSVLCQTYKSYEIILVDDGSTDSSPRICDEYASKYECVKVIHKENRGPSATRNAGVSTARGEYIYFLDSDDYIIPETLEKLFANSLENASDIVFFDAESFVDGDLNFQVEQNYKRKVIYNTGTGLEVFAALNKNKEFKCAVYLMLFKKSLITENNIIFCEDAYMSEDMLFTFQLYCKAMRISQCPEVLYYRRYRADSIVTSRKTQRHFLSCKTVYNSARNFTFDNNLQDKECINNFVVRCAFNALDIYGKITDVDKKNNKSVYDELKREILNDNAYGNKALKMRCYGKFFWVIYKVFEKTVGRLFV